MRYISLPPCFKGAVPNLLLNLTMLSQLLSNFDLKTWTSRVPLTKFLSTFLAIIWNYQNYEPQHHLVVTENNSENKRLVMCFLNKRWQTIPISKHYKILLFAQTEVQLAKQWTRETACSAPLSNHHNTSCEEIHKLAQWKSLCIL